MQHRARWLCGVGRARRAREPWGISRSAARARAVDRRRAARAELVGRVDGATGGKHDRTGRPARVRGALGAPAAGRSAARNLLMNAILEVLGDTTSGQ